jgi:predicted protein tyrosine phosphatase
MKREIFRGATIDLQVLDRASACSVSHDEPYAVISIADPSQGHPHLVSTTLLRGVLTLHFSDVDERFARLNVTSRYLAAYSPEMAQETATFVERLLSEGVRLFVIHCEAGVSRSAGIAAALSRHFNGEESFFTAHFKPNPWVRKLLLEALRPSA